MLIIKAFVNDRQIDEIQIQNVGHHVGRVWDYKIRKPDIKKKIMHCRDKGWEILAIIALKAIMRAKEDQNP